jgi:transposase-like protein
MEEIKCPRCGGTNIAHYYDDDYGDEIVEQYFCSDCAADFEVVYKKVFVKIEVRK